ncbi:hypothetical protein O974_27585 [Mycobacterium avium 11-0986]|nr:hypothetical protein O974_27585 [Mycobacterium avium 11-0986]
MHSQAVAVFIPEAQDERGGEFVFVVRLQFLDRPLARVQGVETVRGVAPFDVVAHGGFLL